MSWKFIKRGKRFLTRPFTLLIIPPKGAQTKSWKMSLWQVACSSLVLVSLVLCCAWGCYSAWKAHTDRQELAKLREINQQYQEELLSLHQQAVEAENYLQEVRAFDQRVRMMTGMDDRGDKTSRSGSTSTVPRPSSRSDSSLEPSEVDQQFTRINSEAVQACETLQALENDLKEYYAYLAALPDHRPVSGRITSPFGMRSNPFGGRRSEFHNGVDFAVSYGAPVEAAGDGVITFTGYLSGFGRTVVISHGYGYKSSYCHLSRSLVRQGERVTKGQKIALAGSSGRSTGPHLHFIIEKDGKEIDPLTVLK